MSRYLDSIEIVLYVDEDDLQSHALNCRSVTVRRIIGPRTTMGACNTACLRQSSGDIVILMNDDVVIRTEYWDERVRILHSTIPDGIYLGYGNDMFKGESLCAFPILSRRTCEMFIDPFPSDYKGAFIDYHLLDVFKRLEKWGLRRVVYLPDVVFEHMHYRTGKGVYDRTYVERDRFGDDDTFLRLSNQRRVIATKLRDAISRPCNDEYGDATGRQKPMGAGPWSSAKYIVFDGDLPLSWRLRLFTWFVQRSLAKWLILLFRRRGGKRS